MLCRNFQLEENEQGYTRIVVETFYELGSKEGYHPVARGYYVVAYPEKVKGIIKTCDAYSGCRSLVLEVQRKSKKSEEKADKMVADDIKYFVDYVCKKNNLKTKEV